MQQYHDALNNKKNTVPSHGYFAKLASFEDEQVLRERGTVHGVQKNAEKCLVKRKTASYANAVEQLTL